jgi:predicted alpha/beta hydrolase family esterase
MEFGAPRQDGGLGALKLESDAMTRRVFILHGYQGYPEEGWFPWLKLELEKAGYEVALPRMPNPDHPVIAEWIEFIAGLVGEPDQGTTLVGHSIGGQAVVRYLERLGATGEAVGTTVLVATNFPTRPVPGSPEKRFFADYCGWSSSFPQWKSIAMR